MKTCIAFFLLLLTFNSQAQLNYGVGASSKGNFETSIGFAANQYLFQLGYSIPVIKADLPIYSTARIGYQLDLGRNYNITPNIGAAYKHYSNEALNISAENKNLPSTTPRELIRKMAGLKNKFHTLYNIEAGKDAFKGRAFLAISIIGPKTFASLGMKMFFRNAKQVEAIEDQYLF